MRIALVLLVSLAVPGALTASAPAASVSVQYLRSMPSVPSDRYDEGSPPIDLFTERVVDADGAANRLAVDAQGRIRDGAVPLTLGEGCAADAGGWATCAPAVPTGHVARFVLAIDAGAGDDTVQLATIPSVPDASSLDLGPGDDRVDVAGGRWTAQGGPGADTISAPRPGGPMLIGFADPVPASWPGTVWDGGPGPDAASGSAVLATYAGRTAGVWVTPDGAADDGESGEGDDVGPDVPVIAGGDGPDILLSPRGGAALGGPGDDLLLGQTGAGEAPSTAHRDLLDGGDGDDTLRGGTGADDLAGGPGDDVLDGGPGDDRLDDGPGADRVAGGEGDDQVAYRPDRTPDVWDGGPGTDTFADLDSRGLTAMDVSLNGLADDGPAGEHDDVETTWEDVHIGGGHLTGSDGPDVLSIETDGTVDGRGGDDRLTGGDRMIGGPGHDVLTIGHTETRQGPDVDVRDGEVDRVECLTATRRIRLRDRADRLIGCDRPEVIVALRPGAGLALHTGARLPLTVSCFGTESCRGRLLLRTGERWPSGEQTYVAWSASSARVSIPLRRPAGRDVPCGHARVTVRLGHRRHPERVTTVDLGRCTWR